MRPHKDLKQGMMVIRKIVELAKGYPAATRYLAGSLSLVTRHPSQEIIFSIVLS